MAKTKKPEVEAESGLEYQEARVLQGWLVDNAYNLKRRTEQVLAMCGVAPLQKDPIPRPTLLRDVTQRFMALGHIELAEALVAHGVVPTSPDQPSIGRSSAYINNHGFAPIDAARKSLDVVHLLASQDSDRIVPLQVDHASRRRPRTEVLAHLLAHRDRWHFDLNALVGGQTALTRTRSIATHDHPYWPRFTPAESYQDRQERHAFQDALIAAGASVNVAGQQVSLLDAGVPEWDHADPLLESPEAWIEVDRALALGVDVSAMAGAAWARAISKDVPQRYTMSQKQWGRRAQGLIDRNVPLVSLPNVPYRHSPFATAIGHGFVFGVKQMLAKGIDPCWQDPGTGSTILTHQTRASHGQAAMACLAQIPLGALTPIVNAPERRSGSTALHVAVNLLNKPLVERVLAEGGDVDAVNQKGQKPMQAMSATSKAAQLKFDPILDLLMAQGADLGQDDQSSAMHKAATLRSASALSKLFAQGHPINDTDRRGWTPFEAMVIGPQQSIGSEYDEAQGKRQVECAKFFIAQGVDLNARLKDGRTLLHHAADRCSHRLVAHLLSAGADPTAKADNGLTPLEVWFCRQNPFQMRWGLATSKQTQGTQAMLRAFFDAGVSPDIALLDLESADKDQGSKPQVQTLLYNAVANSNATYVKFLLASGADPALSVGGQPPAFYAWNVKKYRPKDEEERSKANAVIEAFLRQGVDVVQPSDPRWGPAFNGGQGLPAYVMAQEQKSLLAHTPTLKSTPPRTTHRL